LLRNMQDDYNWSLITEDKEKNDDFARKVSGFLIRRLCKNHNCQPHELDEDNIIKSRIDGRLMSTVHNERQSVRLAGEPKTYCIISSSRLLKQVDEHFRSEIGEPDIVLSLSAIGFLLALTPQVQMGFGTLRSILFDTYLVTRLTPMQRLACRVIAAAGQWDLPWAKRVTLQRTLRQTILEQAKLRGEKPEQSIEKFVRAEDKDIAAQIIADSLDKMAISPKTKEEIIRLKSETKELKAQIEREKAKPKLVKNKEPKKKTHFRRKKK